MKWHIGFAKHANNFIGINHIPKEQIFGIIGDAIRNFQGEVVTIDIRKMKAGWQGFYRIRKGKWRMVAAFDFDKHAVFVEDIDWRGNIY